MKSCLKCSAEIPDESLFCMFCGASQAEKTEPARKPRKPKSRGNGQGSCFKRGNSWYAQVVIGWKLPNDPSKPKIPVKKIKGGFKTKAEAVAYCPQLKLQSTARRRITLEECWNEWSAQYENRVVKSTFAGYAAAYGHFSTLHGTYMDLISLAELQKCMDAIKGYRTRQVAKTTIGLLWRYCIAHNILDVDLSETLYTGKGQSVQREPLTDEEIKTIRENIGRFRYAEYLYVLPYLGLRPGEMLELRKDQLYHYVKRDENKAVIADVWYFITGKKTDAGKDRIVPVSRQILPYILDRAMVPGTDLIFPQYVFDRKEKFLTFKSMSDEFLNKHVFKKYVIGQLGIAAGKVPYSARHSFADMLKEADGTDKNKAALIGHSDYLFTQEKYQSTTIEELWALVESMGK